MEAIGAVASIVQIAQTGIQLSITLYKVADAIGNANKDVQHVAKDVALFSAVLKDLGKALETGQNSRLYREDAYKTSLLIVKECGAVFEEIEEILRKSSKDGAMLDANFSLDRIGKIMWVFRKSRVQLLRGNLESLKSTILVELAVLNYADKVSSPIADDHVNVDDLLALKSLVLANETAIKSFRELVSSSKCENEENGIPTENRDFGSMAISGVMPQAWKRPRSDTLINQRNVLASTSNTLPKYSARVSDDPGVIIQDKNTVFPVSFQAQDIARYYSEIWSIGDRLELALRKVELAKWEHERVEEKLLYGLGEDSSEKSQKKRALFLERLRDGLTKFGLSEERVNQTIAVLCARDNVNGVRAEVYQRDALDSATMESLRKLGFQVEPDHMHFEYRLIKRWMPGYLDDVLWEHTSQLIRKSIPQPASATPNAPVVISEGVAQQKLSPDGKRSPLSSRNGHPPKIVVKKEPPSSPEIPTTSRHRPRKLDLSSSTQGQGARQYHPLPHLQDYGPRKRQLQRPRIRKGQSLVQRDEGEMQKTIANADFDDPERTLLQSSSLDKLRSSLPSQQTPFTEIRESEEVSDPRLAQAGSRNQNFKRVLHHSKDYESIKSRRTPTSDLLHSSTKDIMPDSTTGEQGKKTSVTKDEDWEKIENQTERRKIQNRRAQRQFRKRVKKFREEEANTTDNKIAGGAPSAIYKSDGTHPEADISGFPYAGVSVVHEYSMDKETPLPKPPQAASLERTASRLHAMSNPTEPPFTQTPFDNGDFDHLHEPTSNDSRHEVFDLPHTNISVAGFSSREPSPDNDLGEQFVPNLRWMEDQKQLQSQTAHVEYWLSTDPADNSPSPDRANWNSDHSRMPDPSQSDHLTQVSEQAVPPPLDPSFDEMDTDEEGSIDTALSQPAPPRAIDSSTALAILRPSRRYGPTAVDEPIQPRSSNNAIQLYADMAAGVENASVAATVDDASEYNDYRLQYRRQGIQARKQFFNAETDRTMKAIDGLLKQWTFLDEGFDDLPDLLEEDVALDYDGIPD